MAYTAILLLATFAQAATVELINGRKLDGNIRCGADGRAMIEAGGKKEPVAWTEVRRARFTVVQPPLKPLPKGWHTDEIGKVLGSAFDKDGTFTLTVGGGDFREKSQPLMFARRVVRSEPFVIARILDVSGEKPSVGGVLLRENLEISGGYALLGVSGDKHLRFEWRENTWTPPHQQDLGAVALPIWVKVARLEKENGVTAWRSQDGEKWQEIAQGKLNSHVEPFPDSGDQWKPRLYAGLAITAPPSNKPPATLKCDHAAVSVQGLVGHYFSDTSFSKLAFARPDRSIEYWWGDRSPAPGLEFDGFSVRWEGQIEPRFSENYRFYYESEGARLWVNGEELAPLPWSESRKNAASVRELPLKAGQKYDVRFDFRKTRESKTARLGWSSQSQPREVIPATCMSYTYKPSSYDEEADTTNGVIASGVWLRSGTFLAGDVIAADGSSTQVAFGDGKPLRVLNNRVARVVLRSTRKPIRFELADNRTGVFLRSGDFLESEINEVDARNVVVNSVLFGRKSFSRDASQGALAVVLNNVGSSPASMEVSLTDGSILRARSLRGDGANVVINEVSVGDVRVPAARLQEVRSLAPGQQAKK